MLVNLSVVGINHVTSSRDLREHIAFQGDNIESGLKKLNALHEVESGFILSTCNRLEIYYTGEIDQAKVIAWLADFHHSESVRFSEIMNSSYQYRGTDAMLHFLRVACGLDSMALGETQVLGQMKNAYAICKNYGLMTNKMDSLMQFFFEVTKMVRTKTKIGSNPVSLASTAVNAAGAVLGSTEGKDAMVVGAGDNSRLIIEHLRSRKIGKIYIANRSYEKADALAKKYDGEAVPLIDIAKYLARVHCLFTSTSSPTILVGKGMIEQAVNKWGRKPFFISDMSVPHDVEDSVDEIDQVYLYKLSDLASLLQDNYKLKKQEADKAMQIIYKEIDTYVTEKLNSADDLRDYHAKVDEMKNLELAKYANKDINEETKKIINQFADALTAKIAHGPSMLIRDVHSRGDVKTIDQVRDSLLNK